MCRDSKDAKISSRTQNDDEDVYYLRDYLGRSHSNCDRIQVDEHVRLFFEKILISDFI